MTRTVTILQPSQMPNLDDHLKLKRCPHCSIDNPNLASSVPEFATREDSGTNHRNWRIYKCSRCGGVVSAFCYAHSRQVVKVYPETETVSEVLPNKVKVFLQQAIESTFAPSGSVMLCASAVDAMLKEKGYTEGSLYARIKKATEDGLLTEEMGKWAHQVRLDANDQRHADVEAELPTTAEAKQSIEFAKILAEFLFVLPSKVNKGISETLTSQ